MSTTSDRLGEQAKVVTKDIQEMGGIAKDAAQETLGQLREQAAGYYLPGEGAAGSLDAGHAAELHQKPFRNCRGFVNASTPFA